MKLLITGAAGLVGRALMRRANAEPDLQEVGLDVVWDPAHDVLGGAAAEICRLQPDVVVHLVARVDPPRNHRAREQMRWLHEEGTRRVSEACARVSAHLILVSSAVVYGASPSNPAALSEERPLSPDPRFPYAVDKAAQERIARRACPALSIARPAIVYGRGARSYLTEVLRLAPVIPAVDGARPRLQFVHVEDLAAAVIALARARAAGAFNIASAGTVSFDELSRIAEKRVVDVPARWISPLLDVGARLVPARLRAPSYILDYLRFPFVLDIDKAERELRFRPAFTSAQALATVLGSR